MKKQARQALPWALGTWAVGVQVHELPATLGAWLTAVLTLAVLEHRDTRRWVVVLALVAWCLVAPLMGGHVPSAVGLARVLDFLMIPAAAVAVSLLTTAELVHVGTAASVTLVLSTLVAGLQHFGVWPSEAALAPLAWTKLPFNRVYETVPGRDDRFMAGGFLLHRLKYANVTSAFCVMGAVATQLRVPRWRFFAVATLVGVVGVSIFPHARAASVAMVLSVAAGWIAAAKHRLQASAGAGALFLAAVVLVLAVPSVRARFEASFTGEGSGERSSITLGGLNAVRSSPLVGVGLGRFRPGLFLPADAPAQAREHPGKAHNQFVTLAAEAGVVAALLLVLVLLMGFARGLSSLPAGALAVAGTTLFVLLGLLHDPLFHPEASFALMLLLGAGIGASDRALPPTSEG